eukprot:CAMPEP_0174700400 /NCGR_PEP_ID=MMETSP1094-20130205/5359_1 /TAXON_ID=156173 /ORGANISM="Chrysochromulina brevifilum, Strain UTEX LB 985" /LENGTH=243 /DNA_ID=CAMNT_0015897869 /DNA_START=121 /DNA_END=852 /DNA_ORIENTATION=+
MGPPQEPCGLVASFVARQLIILVAVMLFLAYTFVRVRLGHEKRDIRTLAADFSKQAGQQMFGGALMVVLGVLLAERGLDALAWYGAEYPFEVILTTIFTSWLRHGTDACFGALYRRTGSKCLTPFVNFGQYGPTPGSFLCSWYLAQMVQAVILIGVCARIGSVLLIVLSLSILPEWCSPVLLVGKAWFNSGMACSERTVATLYVMPVVGDAIQFIIIDAIQKFKGRAGGSEPMLAKGSSGTMM